MGMQGDFVQLLKEQGYQVGGAIQAGGSQDAGRVSEIVCATTILAVKYRDGLLVAGDRRATSGNTVMYDRTDKVLELDRTAAAALPPGPDVRAHVRRSLARPYHRTDSRRTLRPVAPVPRLSCRHGRLRGTALLR